MDTINLSNLSNLQLLLMKSLNNFYKNTDNIYEIIPILEGSSKISLRIIDWFVTNYSKKHNTTYIVTKNKNNVDIKEQFMVFLDYRNQLRAYSKKQFDPFCRRCRIQYVYNKDKYLVTTVGQLNFFKWAIKNNILNYISENIDTIEKDMNTNIRKHYKKSKIKGKKHNLDQIKKTEKKKRSELSIAATKFVNKHEYQVTLDFN